MRSVCAYGLDWDALRGTQNDWEGDEVVMEPPGNLVQGRLRDVVARDVKPQFAASPTLVANYPERRSPSS